MCPSCEAAMLEMLACRPSQVREKDGGTLEGLRGTAIEDDAAAAVVETVGMALEDLVETTTAKNLNPWSRFGMRSHPQKRKPRTAEKERREMEGTVACGELDGEGLGQESLPNECSAHKLEFTTPSHSVMSGLGDDGAPRG
nr:hypothetical protein CFP56_21561 [Quercus suber]